MTASRVLLLALVCCTTARAADPLPEGALRQIRLQRAKLDDCTRHIAVSPDGKLLAAECATSIVTIFDLTTGKEVRVHAVVNATVSGLSIHTIGVILMVVGIVGLLLSLMFWSSWGGPAGVRRRTTYVDDAPPPGY